VGRASGVKMGDEGGGSLIIPDRMAPSWIVGVFASDISPAPQRSEGFLLALAHHAAAAAA